MKKEIPQIMKAIEKALNFRKRIILNGPTPERYSDKNGLLISPLTKDMISNAEVEFRLFKENFFKINSIPDNINKYIDWELERIELKFQGDTFKDEMVFFVLGDPENDEMNSKVQITYNINEIDKDLSNGYFSYSGKENLLSPFPTHIVSHLLALCKYYVWLKEKNKLNEPLSLRKFDINSEPKSFKEIWIDPINDIPIVLDILYRLEFIDENSEWIFNTNFYSPAGVVKALKDDHPKGKRFLKDLGYDTIVKAFAEKFKFPNPNRRFERKNSPYEFAREKMANYLKILKY